MTLPVLQPVATGLSGLLAPLGGVVDANLTNVLSGQTIGVNAVNPQGQPVVLGPSTNCSVAITSPNGITLGGGRIDGLGGTGSGASAGDMSAIAIGNGSQTTAGVANAVAFGSGATASTAGAVALGSGSNANRLNSATELFTGAGLRTTLGVVSVGSATNERQITNVAGGTANTDAVNVGQLRTVGSNLATALGGGAGFNGTTGAFTAPTYNVGGTLYNNVGGAIGALDTGTTNNTTTINNILNGTAGLVQQNPTTRAITIGAGTNGTVLSVAGTAGARQITGVAAGSGGTDAVNVDQLTNAVTNITAGTGSPALASENSGNAAPASATGLRSVAVGYGSVATAPDTLSVGRVGAERRVVNVAAGTVGAGSTDAVNGGQLFATQGGVAGNAAALGGGANVNLTTGAYTAPTYTIRGSQYSDVGSAFGAVDTSLGTNATNITNLTNNINNGTIGLLRQDPTTRALTLGAATDGTQLNVAGTAGTRRISGVTAGAAATDAVNVAQLDGALLSINLTGSGAIASENSGLAAPAIATGLRSVAVGYGSVATAPDTLSVGRVGAERRVVNVAAGTLSATSTDAVDGAQLYATNNAVATNAADVTQIYNRMTASLGGGAGYDPVTKAYTFPTFTIRGSNYNNVGAAFAAVDTELGNLGSGGGGGRSAPFVGNSPDGTTPPVAGGANSIAGGYQSTAMGISGAAVGDSAKAPGDYSTSLGGQSMAAGLGSSALGARATAMDYETTAVGGQSMAMFQGSVAIGANSRATADPTTAVGYYAAATGDNAIALGAYATASGVDSTALGTYSVASANSATALGRSASAAGVNSVALGQMSSAAGAGAVAVGQSARADQDGAVAIGSGVTTSRTNQVAIGGAQHSYTLAGLGSGASNAAQSGATKFVTSDSAGTLGTSDYGPQDMGTLSDRVNQVTQFAIKARREARSGTASAMSMTSASMPSMPGKTSWATNTATFKGEWAGGFAVAHRLDTSIPIAVTAGYSYGEAAGHGVRMGLAGEF